MTEHARGRSELPDAGDDSAAEGQLPSAESTVTKIEFFGAARLSALLSGVLACATGGLFAMAARFPEGSRAYAAATLGVLTALLVGSTVQSLLESRREAHDADGSKRFTNVRPFAPPLAVILFLATWVVYPMILVGMGFIASTSIAVSASTMVFARRARAVVMSIVVAVPLVLSLFVVLQVFLNVGMPRAQLDRLVENWAYALLLG